MKLQTMDLPTGRFILVVSEMQEDAIATPRVWEDLKRDTGAVAILSTSEEVTL